MSGVVRSAASFSARRAPAGVGGFHFSATSPRNAIDVDYALWLFHKAMSLRTITVEWKSTCSRFGILFSGFPTFFLFFALRPFACDFSVLSIPGTQTSTPEKKRKDIQLVYEFEKELNNSGKARQAFWRTFVYFYIHIIYSAFFYCTSDENASLCGAKKESPRCRRCIWRYDVDDDDDNVEVKWSERASHGLNKPYVYVK